MYLRSLSISWQKPNLHPLLFITFACSAGIAWQAGSFGNYPLMLIGILSALLVGINNYPKYSALAIIFCSFTLGATRNYYVHKKQEEMRSVLLEKPFDCRGTVTDFARIDHPHYRYRTTLQLYEYRNQTSWTPCATTIQLFCAHHSEVQVGDKIELDGLEIKPIKNSDFAHYLLKEGIQATLFVEHLAYTHHHRPAYSVSRYIHHTRTRILNSLQRKINPQAYQLFASIFLGAKPVPKEELEKSKEHFNTWGVTHYLARSGLHMVIFVFVWSLLFSILPLSFTLKQTVLIALCLLYSILSWPTVSFNRALLSVLLYRFCIVARLPTNFLHVLTLVCLSILVLNPLQLFFLDFQLSFGLTFALALFSQMQLSVKQNY